ncbi:hypothetical protein BDN67DRAFT_917496 [Paxillus ammoniavirescens]|nr:hypothetical protein BDN67DRAFT_917496 [Paxillus ammoniavirescens]
MRREIIRSAPSWCHGPARRDCVFVNLTSTTAGMHGMSIACVLLFLAFDHDQTEYLCALVQWFNTVGNEPDEDTGMWVVELSYNPDCSPQLAIIHADTIVHAAHLLPVFASDQFILKSINLHNALDTFNLFYVNKFADHHTFELAG